MVNNFIPLPIRKYLTLDAAELESILEEYPFFQFPRIAKILRTSALENEHLAELNFFGFNAQKLETYLNAYQVEYATSGLSIHKPKDDTERELHDEVDIHVQEVLPTEIPLESEVNALENVSTQASTDINLSSTHNSEVTDEDAEAPTVDLQYSPIMDIYDGIEIPKLGSEIEILSLDQNPCIIDFDTELEAIETPISNPHTINEPIASVDIEEIVDVQIPEIENSNEDIDASEIQDSSSSVIFELDKIPSTHIDLDGDETILFEKANDSEFTGENADADTESSVHGDIEFNPSEIELSIDIPTPVVEENTSEPTLPETRSEVKDFTDWLSVFSENTASSQAVLIQPARIEEQKEGENELDAIIHSASYQNSFIDQLEPNKESASLHRDDDLEGVLKDQFFKAQTEIKKTNRKTPSELRIQDEAQLSLQPIELISETMAILYTQQGNVSKAIEIYEKLIEQFPEKSSFFALQIENLRK